MNGYGQTDEEAPGAGPCPWCGPDHGERYFDYGGSGPPPMYSVYCGWCGATGPGGYGRERGDVAGAKAEAVKEWNRVANAKAPCPSLDGQGAAPDSDKV